MSVDFTPLEPFFKKCYAEFHKFLLTAGKKLVSEIAKHPDVKKVDYMENGYGINYTYENFVESVTDSLKGIIKSGDIKNDKFTSIGVGTGLANFYTDKDPKELIAYGLKLGDQYNKQTPKHFYINCTEQHSKSQGTFLDAFAGYDIDIRSPEFDYLRK